MARPQKLSHDEVHTALGKLDGWTLRDDGGAITRTFTFKNFVEAWGFMAQSALVAEKLDHHPDWSNVYNRVTVALNTHDVGGITDLDLRLAAAMSAIAAA